MAVANPRDLPAPGTRFASPAEALAAYWGYGAFRGIQEAVIASVLAGHDALALMPTGGGKSLCYQVPAMCRPGVCVVVSPLIALMKDQVEGLRRRGIRAAALFAGLSRREQEAIYDRAQFGGLDLLYLSPERLLTDWTRLRLRETEVSLLAVDEAHCISQWGHDFRPAYRRIAEARELLPGVPVLALTATATPRVADDICEQLGFGLLAHRHTMSFARTNLVYAVREAEDKLTKLVSTLAGVPGSAVVYARSRGRTVEVARELERRGVTATHYHAGLSLEERDAAQAAWLAGRKRVVVATNAFGMGIDKPDVRLVVHLDVPDSLEAYFQEAGRAGRDGQRAYALLLYHPRDAKRLTRLHEEGNPTPDELRRVYHKLGNYCGLALGAGEGAAYDFDLVAFAKTYELPAVRVAHVLRTLQSEELVYVSDAVFRPAMLCVLAGREELYDYCLRNDRVAPLIQAILRTHHGAVQDFVYLKERELSRHLGIAPYDLRKQLQLLHRQKIVEYRPQGELPQLTWTRPRQRRELMDLDWRGLRQRAEQRGERLHASLGYAAGELCRAVALLRYFGEESTACGRCDVCVARRRVVAEVPARYLEKVQAVLRRERLTAREVVDCFDARHHDAVVAAMTALTAEGRIREADGQLELVAAD